MKLSHLILILLSSCGRPAASENFLSQKLGAEEKKEFVLYEFSSFRDDLATSYKSLEIFYTKNSKGERSLNKARYTKYTIVEPGNYFADNASIIAESLFCSEPERDLKLRQILEVNCEVPESYLPKDVKFIVLKIQRVQKTQKFRFELRKAFHDSKITTEVFPQVPVSDLSLAKN